jgi:hypothetical protein
MTQHKWQMVMLPEVEWELIKTTQLEILNMLKILDRKENIRSIKQYLPALEFMKAVNIKRSKFDQLVKTNQVKVIRKGRKLYVPSNEIEKYFFNS